MSENSNKPVVYSVKKGFLKKKIKNTNTIDKNADYKFSFRKYSKIIIAIILILLVGIGTSSYLRQKQKNNDYQKSIQGTLQIKNTNNAGDVVKEFGNDQNINRTELQNSKSNQWDKAKLDKVYFNLLYADKIGSFNDVYAMLSFIDAAKKSGLNIDDNSYGINQQTRNEIKLRADKIVQDRNASHKVNNE